MADGRAPVGVYRERVAWTGGALALFFAPVVLALVLVLPLALLSGSGAWVAALAVVGLMAAIFLAVAGAFRALTITVDDRAVTAAFPLYRRRVPLEEIVACRPIHYRWWEYGGYGVRLAKGGMMLNVGGDGGRAVELGRRGGGALRFSSRDAAEVCAAIHARRPDLGAT